jgi:hypothetical protein
MLPLVERQVRARGIDVDGRAPLVVHLTPTETYVHIEMRWRDREGETASATVPCGDDPAVTLLEVAHRTSHLASEAWSAQPRAPVAPRVEEPPTKKEAEIGPAPELVATAEPKAPARDLHVRLTVEGGISIRNQVDGSVATALRLGREVGVGGGLEGFVIPLKQGPFRGADTRVQGLLDWRFRVAPRLAMVPRIAGGVHLHSFRYRDGYEDFPAQRAGTWATAGAEVGLGFVVPVGYFDLSFTARLGASGYGWRHTPYDGDVRYERGPWYGGLSMGVGQRWGGGRNGKR